VTADPLEIRDLMEDLVFHLEASGLSLLPKAAAFHAPFEAIRPFRDGSGRTGRNITNAMLEAAGFPPVAIKAGDRGEASRDSLCLADR
jgi:Fic family protein